MTKVTYSQLDKVLRTLGFTGRPVPLQTEALVYEHPETGAVIILPAASDQKRALPHHLAAVQGTLKEYGIADPLDLAGELQKAGESIESRPQSVSLAVLAPGEAVEGTRSTPRPKTITAGFFASRAKTLEAIAGRRGVRREELE